MCGWACNHGRASKHVYSRIVCQRLAPYFAQALESLVDHPVVGQVRAKGLVAAVELVKDKGSRERLAPESGAPYTPAIEPLKTD